MSKNSTDETSFLDRPSFVSVSRSLPPLLSRV
jgi:hypothetical protein